MTWQGWLVAVVLVLVAAATTVVRWQLRDLRRQKAEQAKLRQAARRAQLADYTAQTQDRLDTWWGRRT